MVMDFCLLSKQGNFALHFSFSLHLNCIVDNRATQTQMICNINMRPIKVFKGNVWHFGKLKREQGVENSLQANEGAGAVFTDILKIFTESSKLCLDVFRQGVLA